MTLIDLGELPANDLDRPEFPAPPARRLIRPFALALIALLALTTLTTSALPPPQLVRTLWSIPMANGDGMRLSAGTLYLTQLDSNQGRARLTAYATATGVARWTADVGNSIDVPPQLTSAGVVLQSIATTFYPTGQNASIELTETTAAFDNTTGARLWQLDAETVRAAGNTLLMQQHDAKGRIIRLLMIRQLDGSTVWSRAVAANDEVTATDDTVVTVSNNGNVAVLRWADGTVRRTGTVGWKPKLNAAGGDQGIDVIGGNLIVHQGRPDNQSAVYSLDTLTENWRASGRLIDCGSLVCSISNDATVGLDPITGTPRWRQSRWEGIYPLGAGRVLASLSTEDGSTLVIDSATGRTVAALGPGQFARTEHPPASLLLLRNSTGSALHTTVIKVNLATGAQFVLGAVGWLGDDVSGCQAAQQYLACPNSNQLIVTAIN